MYSLPAPCGTAQPLKMGPGNQHGWDLKLKLGEGLFWRRLRPLTPRILGVGIVLKAAVPQPHGPGPSQSGRKGWEGR